MSAHSARLARLETGGRRNIHIVEQFEGMTEGEAYRLRYGDEQPPRGVTVLLMVNPPELPDGVPDDWAERRDDPAYSTWWDTCRAALPAPIRGGQHAS